MGTRLIIDWDENAGILVQVVKPQSTTVSKVVLLGMLESAKGVIDQLETQPPVSPQLLAMQPVGKGN